MLDELENQSFQIVVALTKSVHLWKRGKDYAEEVLSFLNSQHNNIKFTVEHEKDKSIPFLDTKVKRKSDLKFFTTLYHKKLLPARI